MSQKYCYLRTSILHYGVNLFFMFFFFSDNMYIEILDSTRVHPETYEWARKMAVDALEYDEVCVVPLIKSSLWPPAPTWSLALIGRPTRMCMCICSRNGLIIMM